MVIEGSREYKAAQELERALNDYSWNPKRFATQAARCDEGRKAMSPVKPSKLRSKAVPTN